VATVAVSALALAAGAAAAGALAAPTPAARRGAASSAAHHAVVCQHRRGHTILRRGAVRVFKASGPIYPTVYGCLEGSTRAVPLWEVVPGPGPSPDKTGSVKHVAGRFVAVETSTSNQYEYNQALEVFDLRSGASYGISGVQEPIDEPGGMGAPRLETYVLADNGRTAALYATFAAAGTSSGSTPTGQLLEVLGFHDFHQVLATTGPNTIAPASLTFNGQTVSWTQNGEQHSASG
jgi:hypothetical protein